MLAARPASAPASVPHGCCGRPLISQGLLERRARGRRRHVEALHDAAADGEAIVFVEPSCLSTLREDLPALLRGAAPRARRDGGSRQRLFEAFLEGELVAAGPCCR